MDLVPTILDMLDIKIDISFQGQSMIPLIENESENGKTYIFAETRNSKDQIVRTSNYKLIYKNSGDSELYDIRTDPYETNNIIESKKEIFNCLKNALLEWTQKNPMKDIEDKTPFDKEVRYKLKSLGYID